MATLHSNSGRESAGRSTHAGERKLAPKRAASGKNRESMRHPNGFSQEEWHEMVAVAAYYRGQARGFDGASAEDDWYEAEAELRAQLEERGSSIDASHAKPQKRGERQ